MPRSGCIRLTKNEGEGIMAEQVIFDHDGR